MPFVKGQSGNPRGRPKEDYTIASLAKVHTKEVIEMLVAVVRNNGANDASRVAAGRELLDRGWGRSPIVLAGTGGVGPAELTIKWEDSKSPEA